MKNKQFKCNHCERKINNDYYFSNENGSTIICSNCGVDKLLIYSEELDCFVYEQDYKEIYNDDEIADIEKFEVVFCDN